MSGPAWIGVACIGAVGALARFEVDRLVARAVPGGFPVGIFVVNATGAFALGVLVGAGVGGDSLFVAGTGFLGAYTTFSTWMLDVRQLADGRAWSFVWLNVAAPTLIGLALAAAGWGVGSLL